MGYRVEELVDLDVVIDVDAGELPDGELVIALRQSSHCRPVDRFEQLLAAETETPHDVIVDAFNGTAYCPIGIGEREERLMAQAPEDVELRYAHPRFHFCLVPWTAGSGGKHADVVMRGHLAVAAVDLGIVERRLLDAGFEVVGDEQARHAAQMAEHAHVRLDPVLQRLRPGRLRVGVAGSAHHADEDLRFPHLAAVRVHDRDLLAGVVDEQLVAGHVMLAHDRRQPALEGTVQVAEA